MHNTVTLAGPPFHDSSPLRDISCQVAGCLSIASSALPSTEDQRSGSIIEGGRCFSPLRDISCQVAGCVRISSSALPSSRSLVGSTVTPWCSVFMMSTGPPFLVATVGTPCAAACTHSLSLSAESLEYLFAQNYTQGLHPDKRVQSTMGRHDVAWVKLPGPLRLCLAVVRHFC